METMHLEIARIKKNLGTNFWGMTGAPINNPIPMETCPGVARQVKLDPMVPVT